MSKMPSILRVSILGASSRSAYNVEEKTTASQLIALVSNRLNLRDDSQFALYEIKSEEEQRCLFPDEKPWSLVTPSNLDPKLVFKRKIFTREDDEGTTGKEIDKVARDLVYHQAVHCVIEGEYPCPPDEVIRLAALHTLVVYGDHNPVTHVPGFFGPNLSNHIPKSVIATKQAKDWEAAIFKAHAELKAKGKTEEDAKTEYLNTVKNWKCYGTQYFKNCKAVNPPSKSKIQGKGITIGVNIEGITVIQGKEKDSIVYSFPFTDLLSWNTGTTGSSSQKEPTFSFEVGTSSNDPTKYTFETKYAPGINDLVQNYVDVLIQMIRLDIVNETTSPRE